jgi:hypothetical protein
MCSVDVDIGSHLERHGEVKGCDGNLGAFLQGEYQAFLHDLNVIDAQSSDGEVRVRFGDMICRNNHLCCFDWSSLDSMSECWLNGETPTSGMAGSKKYL